MLIGYARVSKSDGHQVLDLQIDALTNSGVKEENIYSDKISGSIDDRIGLENCLKALRENDILVVYKLDRLGRNLKHLIQTVEDLTKRKIGFKVLSGQGVNIDTTTPAGKMIFSIFGALAEFERELIRERTIAGITAARARGRMGGRGLGPDGECVCPQCGQRSPHQRGIPCFEQKCPKCGIVFVPEELALGKMLHVEKSLENK